MEFCNEIIISAVIKYKDGCYMSLLVVSLKDAYYVVTLFFMFIIFLKTLIDPTVDLAWQMFSASHDIVLSNEVVHPPVNTHLYRTSLSVYFLCRLSVLWVQRQRQRQRQAGLRQPGGRHLRENEWESERRRQSIGQQQHGRPEGAPPQQPGRLFVLMGGAAACCEGVSVNHPHTCSRTENSRVYFWNCYCNTVMDALLLLFGGCPTVLAAMICLLIKCVLRCQRAACSSHSFSTAALVLPKLRCRAWHTHTPVAAGDVQEPTTWEGLCGENTLIYLSLCCPQVDTEWNCSAVTASCVVLRYRPKESGLFSALYKVTNLTVKLRCYHCHLERPLNVFFFQDYF